MPDEHQHHSASTTSHFRRRGTAGSLNPRCSLLLLGPARCGRRKRAARPRADAPMCRRAATQMIAATAAALIEGDDLARRSAVVAYRRRAPRERLDTVESLLRLRGHQRGGATPACLDYERRPAPRQPRAASMGGDARRQARRGRRRRRRLREPPSCFRSHSSNSSSVHEERRARTCESVQSAAGLAERAPPLARRSLPRGRCVYCS